MKTIKQTSGQLISIRTAFLMRAMFSQILSLRTLGDSFFSECAIIINQPSKSRLRRNGHITSHVLTDWRSLRHCYEGRFDEAISFVDRVYETRKPNANILSHPPIYNTLIYQWQKLSQFTSYSSIFSRHLTSLYYVNLELISSI